MMISGPPMRPSHAISSRHELRVVHEVAEDQPVPPADDPARPEEERPVLDRGEGVGDRPFSRPRHLLVQRDDADHGDDADEDERAFDDARGHEAERQLLVLSPQDREDHDCGTNVGDDQQQLQEGAEQDLLVVPGSRDVAHRMPEDGLVQRQRRDRRRESDEEEHAEDARSLLIEGHARTPFPQRWLQANSRATLHRKSLRYLRLLSSFHGPRSSPASLRRGLI